MHVPVSIVEILASRSPCLRMTIHGASTVEDRVDSNARSACAPVGWAVSERPPDIGLTGHDGVISFT